MKKFATLLFVSVLGGILTLGTYKLFIEKEQKVVIQKTQETPFAIPVNYSTTNANLVANSDIDFTIAADKTIHTVVHVKNKANVSSQITLEDLFFGRKGTQREQIGTGSGVIISPDGYIITNNHVIEGAQTIEITMNNNKSYDANLIGTDPKTDIALLKIEVDEDLPYTTFGDSDSAKIGEWVLAVGNPFNLTSTVTAGIISAKARDLTGDSNIQSFIQTDAVVNPGNSGGALVNVNGELIGINTAISSQTGSYIGYSFAVPSNIARKVVRDIMEFGNVQNGMLGIIPRPLNSYTAEKFGITETEGLFIEEIEEGSGADIAGLKQGDIIKKLDDIKIAKFSDLKGYLNSKGPNDVINVTFLRNGILKTLPVTLLKNQSFTIPVIGIVKNAKPKELRKYKTKNGVKITRFSSDRSASYWRNNGVYEGDIITAINDIKIYNVNDVETILKNKSTHDPLRIELINSNGETERYNFR
jgi:Do/DeqQ family serine protease